MVIVIREYRHPQSGKPISGTKLVPGATIERGDVHSSSTGNWELCSTPGIILDDESVIWIRQRSLTPDEQDLLVLLNRKDSYCVAKLDDKRYIFVPKGGFGSDGNLMTPSCEHPECLQPLLDIGYLTKNNIGAYEFFSLTELGKMTARSLAE